MSILCLVLSLCQRHTLSLHHGVNDNLVKKKPLLSQECPSAHRQESFSHVCRGDLKEFSVICCKLTTVFSLNFFYTEWTCYQSHCIIKWLWIPTLPSLCCVKAWYTPTCCQQARWHKCVCWWRYVIWVWCSLRGEAWCIYKCHSPLFMFVLACLLHLSPVYHFAAWLRTTNSTFYHYILYYLLPIGDGKGSACSQNQSPSVFECVM